MNPRQPRAVRRAPRRQPTPLRAPHDELLPAHAGADLAAPQLAHSSAAPLRHTMLAGVQEHMGNRAVSTLLRQAAPEDPGVAAFLAARFEKANIHPSTGRGLFDARYVPSTGELAITLKVAFEFKAGSAKPEDTWDPTEERAWAARAIADVQNAWGHQYRFHYQKPGWERLPAVNVAINVVESAKTDAHYVTTVNKRKVESADRDEVVPPGASASQSTATFHESHDPNGIKNPDVDKSTRSALAVQYQALRDKNPQQVFFTIGKADLKPADRTRVDDFAKELAKPAIPSFPVTVTGRASTDGGTVRNQSLSESRAREVSNLLVTGGARKQPLVSPQGEATAGPGPEWRRAEITLGSFEAAQQTVLHEFGHMFGLADEYVDGARTPGAATGHSKAVADLMPGQAPVVAADNDNIMSLGTTVQPHHYVTFLEALSSVSSTAATDWKTTPAPVIKPGTKGDFPTPGPDGPQIG